MPDDNVLSVLGDELAQIAPDLKGISDCLLDPETATDEARNAGEQYVEVVQRLGTAAEILDFQALRSIADFVTDNVVQLAEQPAQSRARVADMGLLDQWVLLLATYFQCPDEEEVCELLAQSLGEADWPAPAPPELRSAIQEGLASPPGAIPADETATEAPPPAILTADDAGLIPAPDVNPDLLDAFLQEVLTQAADLSLYIEHITAGEAGPEELRQAMRLAHTLKGSASLVGIRGVANLTHYIEDVLERLREREGAPPSTELSDVLVESTDCLEMMAEAVLGMGDPPSQALEVMERVREWAAERAPAMKPVSPAERDEEAAVPAAEIAASSTSAIRVPVELVDELMRIGGETTINVGLVQSRLQDILTAMAELNQQNLLVQQRVFELENLIDVRGIPGTRVAAAEEPAGQFEDRTFDPLELDQYNELHSLSRQFTESVTDAREMAQDMRDDMVGMQNMLVQQERLNRELNDRIITARMIPVSNMVPRLRRIVRQTARTTGKEVELDIQGSELMIDTEILHALSEPMMHGLRNAVDHGIESPDERAAADKPTRGRIDLHFLREGNSVRVTLKDDGRGLDYENIRLTAIEKGFLEADADADRSRLIHTIFVPGFTTRTEASEVSGRGVGTDIISSAVEGLKGTLEVSSEPGEGLEIRMRLPVTLVSVHVLFARMGERVFAIPSTSIEQLLFSEAGAVVAGEDGHVYRYGDQDYPATSLGALLGMETALDDGIPRPVLLVHGEAGLHAVIVDQAMESREVVAKGLGPYLPNVRGVSGACIRPDGAVAPLLDLRELLRVPGSFDAAIRADARDAPGRRVAALTVLIVEDSLSARRALVQVVSDAGFEARTAIDGLEAISAVEENVPDIVLADLEMPRMNGLELTAHLRAHPETSHLPVVMVTSRSTQKHREQADAAGVSAYVTKPFDEAELVGLIHRLVNRG